MILESISIVVAVALDFILGDPAMLPHPIVAIGKSISLLERLLRRIFPVTERGEFAGGVILGIMIPVLCFVITGAVIVAVACLNIYAALIIDTFLCYQILAAKSLERESMKVFHALQNGTIEDARRAVSMIVGRDTEQLSAEGVTKAAVETIAENTSDGAVAPLIYMAIGGAPLAMMYKGVNTLDSMVGYKNDKYLYFGRFSAKLDDVFNFIPARISGLLMVLSAGILRLDMRGAYRIFKRDRYNHASPNSAQTESACAGALNIQLAGNAYYFGELYQKPGIGDDIRPIEANDIVEANRLMYAVTVLATIVALFIRLAIIFLVGVCI